MTRITRVLVTGGRNYHNRAVVWTALNVLQGLRRPLVVIHGGATGADALAADWAREFACAQCFPADWERDGRAAGPIRNARMLVEGRPDLVLAFPGGRGTADMIRRADAAAIPIIYAEGSPNAT